MTREEKLIHKLVDDVNTLSCALTSAFNWLYEDTYQLIEGKKPMQDIYDITFRKDLRRMQQGYRLLKGLPEPDEVPQQRE